jgi:hypothetical protein
MVARTEIYEISKKAIDIYEKIKKRINNKITLVKMENR